MEKDETLIETATFAGGCFWCTESDFERHDGVLETKPGYTGGHKKNPTYEEVASGRTGHIEAVRIRYDPNKISYDDLLNIFWRHVDPTDCGGQFVDRGAQYRTAIFYHNDDQKKRAETTKQALSRSGLFSDPVVTEILPVQPFYEAENYHQGYHKKNPLRYKFYRRNSGRDQFLRQVWTGTASHDRHALPSEPQVSSKNKDRGMF
jgi:peptide methionine sulfoxide reductase msrA/msrB